MPVHSEYAACLGLYVGSPQGFVKGLGMSHKTWGLGMCWGNGSLLAMSTCRCMWPTVEPLSLPRECRKDLYVLPKVFSES